VTKEKEAGKNNRSCFSPFALRPFPAPKNRARFAPFPDLPARRCIWNADIAMGVYFSIRLFMALKVTYCAPSGLIVNGGYYPPAGAGGYSHSAAFAAWAAALVYTARPAHRRIQHSGILLRAACGSAGRAKG